MDSFECEKCGMEVPERIARGPAGEHADKAAGGYVCALCEPPKGSRGSRGGGGVLLKLLFIGVFAVPGFFLQKCSYERVAELRQIARVPRTKVMAAVAGEVNLSGKALRMAAEGPLLRAVDSQAPCLYYLYRKERKETDSDGDVKWVSVDRREEFVPFHLDDGTGRLRVEPSRDVDFNVPESHRRRSGDFRFIEYRIDPGDRVFVFGYLEGDKGVSESVVGFRGGRDYRPIVSKRSELAERKGRGLVSIWLCWGGLCFVAMATASLFWLSGLHRMLVFFGLLSAVVCGVLVYLGLRMMVEDLTASQGRVIRQEEVVRRLIMEELAVHGEMWSGTWETLGDLSRFKAAPASVRTRLRRVRIDQVSAQRRVRRQAAGFPYNLVRPLVAGGLPSEISLTDRDEEFLRKIEAQFEEARVSGVGGTAGCLAGLLVGAGAIVFGFRAVGRKRLVENLPTTPTSGVAYGLVEVRGLVDLPEDEDEALWGPLSQQPCVAYFYRISEKRRSGKRTKWVTIREEQRRRVFRCIDREGVIGVDPEGAEIDPWRQRVRRKGRLKYEEKWIRLGDPVFVLGPATLDSERGDRLRIARPPLVEEAGKDRPFLVSGFREAHVLKKGAAKAAAILTAAFCAFLFSGLMFSATLGSFNPASYLVAALVGPLLMIVVVVVLHFNDLIFLRERCRRNRANVDVALKKRYELIPQIVRVVSETMAHEKRLQQAVAELRTAGEGQGMSLRLGEAHAAVAGLWALGEDYPEIRSGGPVAELSRQLVVCENEIAFISQAYNDAVEVYNARIASFPDLLLARWAGFRPLGWIGDRAEKLGPIRVGS